MGTGKRRFAWGSLSVRAGLWGLVLGALAPVTTAVILLSGTAEEGATLGQVDMGFFGGFMPMMVALVAFLVTLNHWPLRDMTAYHRELMLALLLVGVVEVAELRLLTQQLTSEGLRDTWLFVNGSMVIHALLVYWLVRGTARHLAGVHAHHAGWPSVELTDASEEDRLLEDRPLRSELPRYAATGALGLRGLLWGIIIATISGAAAGTLLVPVLGTLVGAYFGAIYGLVPAVLGALTVVVAVSWRRDTDPAAVERTVNVALVLVGLFVLVGLWPSLQAATLTPSPWEDADLVRTWLSVVPVVVLLIRYCAPKLARTYIRFSAA